ncbi:MAG TPA: molybdopterin molybdotransferase MoeA [Thermomicrobiales bacterium]|nr:molybdopterin molybdotransferase MoeA [Thermomicrobiales bacterium]
MPESTTDRMLHPDEARAIVLAHATPLEPEVVPIADAGDHILADPLIADVSLPPFPAATMDGYAIVHDDPAPLREILGSGFAGDAATLTVAPGKAAKIMTGAPVPAGANAVVPVERTALVDGRVEIQQATVRDGENIRPVGADLREGDLLVPAGVRLGPAELGLLASLGHASVRVGRAPRVAVFSTGNELVDPGEEPGPGQIRDSNRFSLALAARRAGAEIVRTARLADEEAELRAALNAAIGEADVVLSSGGVSMGDKDLVKLLLGELAEVHFRRLFMKPGKPLTFATVPRDDGREVLLFGLPGNPVSCLVGFQMFVRPALQVLQSAPPESYPTVPVVVDHDIPPSDRIEYQRAIVSVAPDGTLRARNTGSQMSARLMSFVGANAFLVVPPGENDYPAGSRLEAILIDPPRPAAGDA